MFRGLPMKKTSLKAKNHNASSGSSSKQTKLETFFVKMSSPNKENFRNEPPSTASQTPFMCLSDTHEDVSVIDSSIAHPTKTGSKVEKSKVVNSGSHNSSDSNKRSNKRKSSGSSDSKNISADESLIESSLRETNNVNYPESKRVNLNSSDTIACTKAEEILINSSPSESSDEIVVSTPDLKRTKRFSKHSRSTSKFSSKPDCKPFNSENQSNDRVSRCSRKKSPLGEKNEDFESPAGSEDTLKSKSRRDQQHLSSKGQPVWKPAPNVSSVLFESVTNSPRTMCEPDSKLLAGSRLSDSSIDNALKSRAIFSKLKGVTKSASTRSREPSERTCANSAIKLKPSGSKSSSNTVMNSNVSLFEETSVKSTESTAKDIFLVREAGSSECSRMFEDTQVPLNRKHKVREEKLDDDSFLTSYNFKKRSQTLFESTTLKHTPISETSKSLFQDTFPSIIPCTADPGTNIFPTPPNTSDFVENSDEISPVRFKLPSKINQNAACSSPLRKIKTPINSPISSARTAVPCSPLSESCGSIVGSSELEQLAISSRCGKNEPALHLHSTFDDDLMFEDWDFSSQNLRKLLTLNTMKKCKIMEIQVIKHEKSITVQLCEDESAQANCKLRESWFHTILSVGDIVNIVAEFKQDEWVIDNSGGLLIQSPDTLISGTTLMGSMFCQRRAVLSNAFPIVETGAKCMVVGSLVHLLLQKVMQDNIRCEVKIDKIIQEMVSDPAFVHQLLLSGMEFDEMKKELADFTPEILKFMETYVFPDKITVDDNKWSGKITAVKDIEENIWSPTFGIKGKIDVTVEVKTGGMKKTMPFELKTGRSSNSAEHRGQVILYVMMMAELGYNTDSGLLFYLKDGQMKEVPVDHRVKRDIMMLRNSFIHNLQSSHVVKFLEDGSIIGPDLPEPISHHSACTKCPYQTICCAMLVDNNMSGVHPKNVLTSLASTTLSHLKSLHIRYVFHWAGLLKIEEAEKKSRSSSSIKDLWCLSPDKREETGMCVANLTLSKVEHVKDSFIHTFNFKSLNIFNNFIAGDYVVISSDTRPAIVCGGILNISENRVTLGLEKDLSIGAEKVFHMDRYESQTLLNFDMSNLNALLNDTARANELRQAIVELKLPSFTNNSTVLSAEIVDRLNNGQKKAVLRAFAAQSYMLIEGMPGCGKTETLVALVRMLVKKGKSVLVTSHTHSAVDNLALRLQDLDLLRLGKKNKINPSLRKFSEEALLAKSDFKTLDDVRCLYSSKSVVAVTVLGCSHPVLSLRRFDVCIVDEATQVLQPSTLRPLLAADKFILVGDPLQLPPLVLSSTARSLGLSESLFNRLNRPAVTVILNLQYRMNRQITALANKFMYQGALECANETVANNTLSLLGEAPNCPWLKVALSSRMEYSVVFVDVRDTSSEGNTCENLTEAKVLMVAVKALKNGGLRDESIGVIAAYRAQVNLLRQLTEAEGLNIEVNTIDQYQGRDKDVILFSCSVQASASEGGILSSNQRLSVAITRAKQKLLFFGNSTVLKTYKTFEKILQCIDDKCVVRS